MVLWFRFQPLRKKKLVEATLFYRILWLFFYLDLELKNNQGDASLPCMKGRCTMAHKSSRRLPYAFSIHSKNLILFWGNSFYCDLPDIKQITSMIDIFLLCFALILIFSDALGILFLRAAKVHVYSPLWPL